jgi:hypothetical protein
MQTDIAHFAGTTLLRDLRERVEAAAGIAKAAHVLADAGLTGKGVEIANDVDELIHDAEGLLGLVTVVARSAEATRDSAPDDSGRDAHDAETEEAAAAPIDSTLADATIRAFLAEADARLHAAVGIARAAEICVAAGKLGDGVRIALDIEVLLYDARHLVNTASIVRRTTTT